MTMRELEGKIRDLVDRACTSRVVADACAREIIEAVEEYADECYDAGANSGW